MPTSILFLLILVFNDVFAAPAQITLNQFKMGWEDGPSHPLHYLSFNEYALTLTRLTHDPLIEMGPDSLIPIPRLAKKWEWNAKKKGWILELDSSARFSDGAPITSNDILFTWNCLQEPLAELTPIKGRFRDWQGIKKIDSHHFIILTASKNLSHLYRMAQFFVLPQHLFNSPQEWSAKRGLPLMGSGPYTLEESKIGQHFILKRTPLYWGSALPQNKGRYNFEKLIFPIIPEGNARMELLKRGEIDALYVNVTKTWMTQTGSPEFEKGYIQKLLIENKHPHPLFTFIWNLRRPQFQDIRVRKALAHLMNRESWLTLYFYNQYKLANTLFPHLLDPSKFRNREVMDFDPAKAKTLLKEAGWTLNSQGQLQKEGKAFQFEILSDTPALNTILTAYQEDLAKAGIQMKIRNVDWTTEEKLLSQHDFDAVPQSNAPAFFPTAGTIHGELELSGYQNPALETLLQKLEHPQSEKQRLSLLTEIDALIAEAQPMAMGWQPKYARIAVWNRFTYSRPYLDFSTWNNFFDYWEWQPEKDKKLRKAQEQGIPFG